MKACNITWENPSDSLPEEIKIPKTLIPHICHKEEITPSYNFLTGYSTGIPKKWWYGIENITFIFMGAWNDPYIGYKNYAINSHLIEDSMWDRYNEEYPAPDYKTQEYQKYQDAFQTYMQNNKEEIFELLDDILDNMHTTVANYLKDTTKTEAKSFTIKS